MDLPLARLQNTPLGCTELLADGRGIPPDQKARPLLLAATRLAARPTNQRAARMTSQPVRRVEISGSHADDVHHQLAVVQTTHLARALLTQYVVQS